MIKKLTDPISTELDQMMDLWLMANVQAHDFIAPSYWEDHLEQVRQALPEATLFVYLHEEKIIGFLGLTEQYIGGLFVDEAFRGQGIGKQLLDEAQKATDKLALAVYQKNQSAYRFYLKQGFQVTKEVLNEETQEKEYLMAWAK